MKYSILLFLAAMLAGCGSFGPFAPSGAAYSFEKEGDHIVVKVSDTQEIDSLDASAEPIVLKDGTVICCRVSIKKGAAKSTDNAGDNLTKTLNLIRDVAPLLKGVP